MMSRILIAVALLGALAGLSGTARADELIARHFERARILQEEGKTGEAIDAYRLVIREWPEDPVFTPQAHLGLVVALLDANRVEDARRELDATVKRYDGWEKLLAEAERLRLILVARTEQQQSEEALDTMLEAARQWALDQLKAQGLAGEELERAYREAAKRIEIQARYAEAREQYERVRKLWEEQGISPDEIKARAARIAEEREQLAARQKDLEHLARRLEEEGASQEAIRGELEGRRKRIAAEHDGPRPERREEEMRRTREEFLHLAEKLGIPGEDAERFLEEHRDGRHRMPPETPELSRRMAEMEKRFDEIAMHLERFAHHMEMRTAESNQTLSKLAEQVVRLQQRLEEAESRQREGK